MTEDAAHTAQTIADDALTVVKALGIVCPPVEVVAVGAKFVVDVAFAIVLREAAKALAAQVAAQTAGVAAAEASAATSALEHARATGSICSPCIQTFSGLIAEHKAANT